MEKGSIAVWQQRVEKQWEVYSTQQNEFGGWTTPQNISQTSADSKYSQVSMYQTISTTRLVYVWTEGNASPYEVKILPVSSFRSNPIPLYAFDLGEKEPSLFVEKRTGYIIYGSGFEKSVDYDTSCLKYRITGLDRAKNYQVGLVFYQDENNGIWKQGIAIDDSLIKTVHLPRRKTVVERFFVSPEAYQDGEIELSIKHLSIPKVVLSTFAVWEFSGNNFLGSSIKEQNNVVSQEFSTTVLPNPAKGMVELRYQLPKSGEISLKIYSVTGQLVRMIKEAKSSGDFSFIWDGRDERGKTVPSGIYFVRVEFDGRAESDKIILLR